MTGADNGGMLGVVTAGRPAVVAGAGNDGNPAGMAGAGNCESKKKIGGGACHSIIKQQSRIEIFIVVCTFFFSICKQSQCRKK